VQPNTALYFRSGAGVIQATVFTSDDGEGTADLISGDPQPLDAYADPALGNGYHYVVARTIGESGVTVIDSTLMLWSGLTEIKDVNPIAFDIPNGRDTVVTFNVSDRFGHPLSAGTKISVSASVPPPPCPDCEVNTVLATFGVGGSVTLDDHLFGGFNITDFAFVLSDGSWEIDMATPVTITISVTSENGNAIMSFSGVVY
jgi:hypothetical protein